MLGVGMESVITGVQGNKWFGSFGAAKLYNSD